MEISCKFCKSHFVFKNEEIPILFCPSCGNSLQEKQEIPFGKQETILEGNDSLFSHSSDEVSLVQGHLPKETIEFSIGPYQILKVLGKGGMGEVFLAYDTTCGRRIALKRIREDLTNHKSIHQRFLKEARVTSQLTHPAIIPIYFIEETKSITYYTMPFVEGETLKTILKEARLLEKKGEKPHPIGGSIPPLARIFLTICQAVAYAHSKGVLHRDLKPENIIVGKFGEVFILDWGLAKLIDKESVEKEVSQEIDPPLKNRLHDLTHMGKVVGTISYMAPERGLGLPATFQTDIYSLGVILYQILTLRAPFKRGSLKEFRLNMEKEELYDPVAVAPYRDVPEMLSKVVLKCLSNDLNERYKHVEELMHAIENYLEGRSEWFLVTELQIDKKSDWEFQENVLMAEHLAITREAEVTDWVSLMISKHSFSQNIKIETEIEVKESCHGIGFLLSIPEKAERVHLNDGYYLFIGTEKFKSTKLLSSTVEVFSSEEVYLTPHKKHKIRIEKIENNIHLYLDEVHQFSYISHNPLVGTHIGLISKDANFSMTPLSCYQGSESIEISCLAVPDAFFAHKNFHLALNEYRRIGYSFPGTREGREALFRAGITLLEMGKNEKESKLKEEYIELALKEFSKLHGTPGAPFEYLGKALVYEGSQDLSEEIKCYELAFRRYPKHPLLPIFYEHILYRLYQSSRSNRQATYHFSLLALRFLPGVISNRNSQKLFSSLRKNWEPLSFLEPDPTKETKNLTLQLILCFWLGKPYALIEIMDLLMGRKNKGGSQPDLITLMNAIFSLILLGSFDFAKLKIQAVEKQNGVTYESELLKIALLQKTQNLESLFDSCFILLKNNSVKKLEAKEVRILTFLLREALKQGQLELIEKNCSSAESYELDENQKIEIDFFLIAVYLIEKKWDFAGDIFRSYPLELLYKETTPLHFLYGCFLYMTEGKDIAMIHFGGSLEVPFPRSFNLASHYIHSKKEKQLFNQAFLYERREFYFHLSLFYKIVGEPLKALEYEKLEEAESIDLQP